MSEFVEVFKLISPTALPLVVVLLGGLYLWLKFGRMEKDRQETKIQRDSDSQNIHDEIQRHSWELNRIKEDNGHRDQLLEDLRKQVEAVNSNLAVVATKLDHLVDAVRGRTERDA